MSVARPQIAAPPSHRRLRHVLEVGAALQKAPAFVVGSPLELANAAVQVEAVEFSSNRYPVWVPDDGSYMFQVFLTVLARVRGQERTIYFDNVLVGSFRLPRTGELEVVGPFVNPSGLDVATTRSGLGLLLKQADVLDAAAALSIEALLKDDSWDRIKYEVTWTDWRPRSAPKLSLQDPTYWNVGSVGALTLRLRSEVELQEVLGDAFMGLAPDTVPIRGIRHTLNGQSIVVEMDVLVYYKDARGETVSSRFTNAYWTAFEKAADGRGWGDVVFKMQADEGIGDEEEELFRPLWDVLKNKEKVDKLAEVAREYVDAPAIAQLAVSRVSA